MYFNEIIKFILIYLKNIYSRYFFRSLLFLFFFLLIINFQIYRGGQKKPYLVEFFFNYIFIYNNTEIHQKLYLKKFISSTNSLITNDP